MRAPHGQVAWLKGGEFVCTPAPRRQLEPRRLLMLGAPGTGKTTQAKLLSQGLGACHLSIRDALDGANSPAARQRTPALHGTIEATGHGEFVPDATMIEIVRNRFRCLACQGGFLLDGFPRTLAQAQALDQMLKGHSISLEAVLNYCLPPEQTAARLLGRRVCANCQAIFHATARPPLEQDVCDHCGGKLGQPDDDQPAPIRRRLEVYEKSAAPLVEYYRKQNLLVSISADGTPEEVYRRSVDALNERAVRSLS
jgi:adenylate kinase